MNLKELAKTHLDKLRTLEGFVHEYRLHQIGDIPHGYQASIDESYTQILNKILRINSIIERRGLETVEQKAEELLDEDMKYFDRDICFALDEAVRKTDCLGIGSLNSVTKPIFVDPTDVIEGSNEYFALHSYNFITRLSIINSADELNNMSAKFVYGNFTKDSD